MPNPPASCIADAIALAWPHIEASVRDPLIWRSFSARLLKFLRELEEPGGDSKVLKQGIEALFAEVPAAQAELHKFYTPVVSPTTVRGAGTRRKGSGLHSPWAMDSDSPSVDRARDLTTAPTGEPTGVAPDKPVVAGGATMKRRTLISVLFGTDRTPVPDRGKKVEYSDKPANELHFGVATVSIPDDHKKGYLERPRWYRLEFRECADQHVMITSLSGLSHDELVAETAHVRQRDGSSDEALIFVHGYRVGFEESIQRTAQFAVDLEFRGMAIAYSWPSKASLFGYGADANASETSMFMLAEFIALVRSQLGFRRVHVVAHSMGSRLLARALNQHTLTPPVAAQAPLNQVIFAAPDIDPITFANFAKVFTRSCERCTLYASSHDLALTASKWIYRRTRTGDTSVVAMVTHGVDTIDASKVDQSLLGHSYFTDQRSVLADLHEVLVSGSEPGLRFGLTEVPVDGGRYWEFTA